MAEAPLPQKLLLEQLDPLQLELLRRRLEKSRRKGPPAVEAIARVPDAESYPVSFAQQRLWFFDQWAPESPAYNIPAAVRLRGPLELAVLFRCFDEVQRRHESLRTTIGLAGGLAGEEVVQRVAPPGATSWPLVDLAALPEAAGRPEADRLSREEARRPFRLAEGPLLRLTVLRLAPGEHLLVQVLHHIVSDAWSTEILVGEIAALYGAWSAGRPSPLPELPIQYRDYAVWQRRWLAESEALGRQRAYWLEHLRGAPPVVQVPTDRPRGGVQRLRGQRLQIRWAAERADQIRQLAQACGATPFMVLLAVFEVLLVRYTGQRDLVVGTLVAHRTRKQIERLIGWFANTLVLRTDLAAAATYRDALEGVRQTALDAFAHQDLPFEKLVEELNPERNLSYNVLFQMAFVLLDEVREGLRLDNLEVESFEIEKGVANFDLYFSLMVGPRGVSGWVDSNVDLYDAATVRRVFEHFGSLLSGAARHPDAPLGELPLLSTAERHQLVREWNDSRTAYAPAATVIELFVRQAERTPAAAAVTFEGETLTYRDLDRRSNQLARHLRGLGVGPEVVVGVLLDRSLELVVALYGILKAGGAYLPLEPTFPAERLELLCASAGAPVVLTREPWRDTAARLAGASVVLDADWHEIAAESGEPQAPLAGAGNLAYVIYTSGSTGQPKGVENVHGALVNRLLWMQAAYPLDASDAVMQKTPFVFDVSVWELFWPLITGARLVVARPEGHRDAAYLAGLIRSERVTTLHFVPSMLRLFLAAGSAEDLAGCAGLRQVISSGEALTGDLIAEAHRRLGAAIHNLYGPTEAAIDVTSWTAPRPSDPAAAAELSVVPIGRPIGNLRLHVLDRDFRPAPSGALGELLIGGAGLARGYRQSPELTAGAFVPDPVAEEPGARLYRTGDLARVQGDGTLEFLGRIDHQVKVRGLRIELGEIEACLEAQPGVRQAVVLAREDVAHDQRLVAYLVPAAEPGDKSAEPLGAEGLEAIDGALRRRLPDYMVPGAYVVLPELPLTTSGKVDRRALPRPEGGFARGEEAAPRTAEEERLATAFAEVLGVARVGIHDSFFRLGGHSLLATQLLTRVSALAGADLTLQELFETPTVAGLAPRLRSRRGERGGAGTGPTLVRQPSQGGEPAVFPLSFAQERLWFVDVLDPGLLAYNEPSLTRIRGPLRQRELARAFREVIARHEALRTTFRRVDERPVQVVAPAPSDFALPRVDLRLLPAADRAAAARRSAVALARQTFDLAEGPLLRAVLFRVADDEHLLLMVFHHIVADGWSYVVVLRELALAYQALAAGLAPALPELPVQYGDFALWQRGRLEDEALARPLAFWRERLAGAPEVLELPTDRPRPVRSSRQGGQVPFHFPAELHGALARRAGQQGATLFVLLLAAYQALLRAWSGSEDLVVGMPVAGRSRPEIERLVGFFVNTLALRATVRGGMPLAELLAGLQREILDALAHQDLPFDRLVQELPLARDRSHPPVFQVMLAFQNELPGGVEVPGLALRREGIAIGTSKFDLNANLYELDGRLEGWLEYDSELFDPTTAARLAGHFRNLLAAVAAADPATRVAGLPLLGAAERHQVTAEWNDTADDLAAAGPGPHGPGLHQLFEAQVERTPGAVAVRSEEGDLTYRDLDRQANRLSHWLRARGVGPGTVVGVMLDRSPALLVAIYGVLKAGGAYLPLDPFYPEDRLAFMVADAAPRLVLTVCGLAGLLPPDSRVVALDAAEVEESLARVPGSEGSEGSDLRPEVAIAPGDLAYVIYTSGSTGLPKAAMNGHRGILNRILWMQAAYGLGESDRVLQKTPFSFDVSVWELFWPLAVGARLVLARPGGHRDPAYLVEAIAREGITTLHFVPSMLRAFLEAMEAKTLARLTSVRRVIASGEELTADLAARCHALLPAAELHNLYGPTEAAVDVTAWPSRPEEAGRARLPIGRPIANISIHLLDREGLPTPLGVPGELHIGGVGVGSGYLGRPDLTAARFVPDPFGPEPGGRLYRTGDLARHRTDGAVEFLGRTDFQVKIHGVRIELPEIEAALQRCPGVAEAAVLARRDRGEARLVAYVVPGGDARDLAGPLTAAGLKAALRETLPEAMVPAALVFLEAMPLSPNGKLDRRALPEPEEEAGGGEVAPRTPIEEMLAGIWAELLGVDRFGVEDDPFERGAHSLMATRVQVRIHRELGVDLPLRRLFELPTVARLAAEVERRRGAAGSSSALPALGRIPRDGDLPLSFAQERLWFFDRWEPGSPVFNQPGAVRLEGELDVAALTAGVHEIVRRHETLRSRFQEVGGAPVLVIEEPVRRPFPVVDLADLPAARRRAEEGRLAHEEARRPFDLQRGPLLRATLLRLAPREHLALVTLHHVVSDGWSLWIFTRELGAAYAAFAAGRRPDLPELPIQFTDYAAWQRQWLQGEALERELDFWKGQVAGAPAALDLPFDRPRGPVQRYRGGRAELSLPPDLTARLRAVGRSAGGTLFMTLLAAWKTLLGRYARQADVTTGTVIANRHRREVEGLIGFFINTLPIRLRLAEEAGLRHAIARLRDVTLEVYGHQDMPFEKLVEELNPDRHLSFTPLFQVMLILQNTPPAALDLPGLRLAVREVERGAVNYDLVFYLEEGPEGLGGHLDYDIDLFDGATVRRLLGHFESLLAATAADPDRPLAFTLLLSAAERQHLLVEWNDTSRQSGSPLATFSEMFEEQAALRPTAWAAACPGSEGDERITYRDLAERVDRMARELAARGVTRDQVVPVLADRGLPFLSAVLAILRCGAAFLPLDPGHPPLRIGQILDSARGRLAFASRGHGARLAAALAAVPAERRPVPAVLEELIAAPFHPDAAAPPRGVPENLAYVIFTSGSTGRPKGVMVELRGLLNNLRSKVEDLPLNAGDVVAQTTSQCFDTSVWQFLAVLAAGGTVHILPDEISHHPLRLLEELERAAVAVVEIVPAMLQAILDEADRLGPARPALARLRWVMPTGEALPSDLCRRWLALYPAIPLLNVYGPSECSDDSSTLVIAQGWEAGERITPIGRPLRNARLYVLDRRHEPVPAGVPGELFVGGVCLGRGYLHDPARTAWAFLPDGLTDEPGARLYRSGDVGRHLADGRIEFLGRLDHQVKIRGFRIEIGEIESVLRQDLEVSQAVVMARGAGSAARLVGYVVPQDGADPGELPERLRAGLAERLPDYMVPAVFVILDRLPLSPNGKVDRFALPEPEPGRGQERIAPRTRTEKAVAEIWTKLLGVPEVGIGDSFFDLGGHSLLATRVLARIQAELGVTLPLRDLFEARDLAALAALLDGARGVADPASVPLLPGRLPAAGEAGQLSFAQERLWFLDQFDPGSPAYNLFNAVHIAGALRPPVLARALDEIAGRHATLRMTFHGEAGRPRFTVQPRLALDFPEVDLRALSAPAAEAETGRLARAEARQPFDLERGPLLRATLLRRRPAEHVLLVNMHHIVSDGWSLGIFLSEVAALYPALAAGLPSPLPALPVQYPDYSSWQRDLLRGELLVRQLAYWTEQLADPPEALDLPGRPAGGARPAVLGSVNGGTRRFRLPAAPAGELRDLSRRQGTTLFMTLMAGFAGLLHRYCGALDLTVGIPIAGRGRPELEQLIGFFVNTLVVRVGLDGAPTSEELLGRVRRASLDAFTHQDLPFEKLVAELNPDRDLTRSPLFQVMFALQNAPAAQFELPDLTLSRFEIDTGTIRFELYLELTEDGEELDGVIQFSRDLFEPPFIARFVEHYRVLLAGMSQSAAQPLAALPLLSAAERAQLLKQWNDSAAEVPSDRSFARLFEERVARHPGRLAAACDGERLTYAELDARANAMAEHLVRQGVEPETVVALLAERGLDFLTAMLGVWKAGGVYLPLDPRHPPSRIRQVLEQSRSPLVLCAGALLPQLSDALAGFADIGTEDAAPALLELEPLCGAAAAVPSPARGSAEHLAYVIFTSGSTGVPKGAMLVHRGMINHLFAKVADLGLGEGDVVAQTASQCFDISVWQFLAPLAVGGRVEIYADEVAHDPAVLLDRVETDGVTVLETVPSLMRLMLQEIQRRGDGRPRLADLRWLIPTGEALPPELCRDWYAAYPWATLLNAYGPTECSDDVSHYRVRAEDLDTLSIPIGRPVVNTGLYVLDSALAPLPLGVVGELYVGGDGVGRGYLFDPGKTAVTFVPDPCSGRRGSRLYRTGDLARRRADGDLEFLGRIDHQVKIRGFRLELGEIEALLAEQPALAAAVVMARPDASGGQRLVAYVVPQGPAAPTAEELRDALRSRLPEYAIPTAWLRLESLPLTANGKVDRRALPEVDDAAAENRPYVEPRTEVEAAVAEIFAAVVGIERVGVFDNFFDIGGHSLLATQATWRLRETFGVELALRALFEAPTVAELAGLIEDRIIEQIESLSEDEVDSMLEGDAGDLAETGERELST